MADEEAVYAADGGYVIRKDNLDDLRATVSQLAQENLRLRGARVQLAGLGEAVKDLCWKATPFGETEDGDVYAYIIPKGTVHRLIGVAQSVGITAAFRANQPPADVDQDLPQRPKRYPPLPDPIVPD